MLQQTDYIHNRPVHNRPCLQHSIFTSDRVHSRLCFHPDCVCIRQRSQQVAFTRGLHNRPRSQLTRSQQNMFIIDYFIAEHVLK